MNAVEAAPGVPYEGKCLCGAVSIRVRHDKPTIGACHCNICRRWGGGPFISLETHTEPEVTGTENIKTYDSSEWAERGFCARCGTHLYYRLKSEPFYAIAAGLFEQARDWPFTLQVFIDQKPESYSFLNRTKNMTGEEVFKAWEN